MTDLERKAEELQRRREALDRMQDDDNNSGGKPLALPDWGQGFPLAGDAASKQFSHYQKVNAKP